MAANPLSKIDKIDTRGKQVRERRASTEDELHRLFAAAGRRLPAYLVLLHTGQRKEEVRSLVWGDLHLDGQQPYVLIRESTPTARAYTDVAGLALQLEIAMLPWLHAGSPADRTAHKYAHKNPANGRAVTSCHRTPITRKRAIA